jgi:2-(1,2-epoxy-1,2-dihydrophenyl)acetyl-CoA isomerase
VAEARTELSIGDGIARLRLVRGHGNAIDPAMISSLAESVTAAVEPGAARAILITAEGPTFTVGGDLDHFLANVDRLEPELDSMIGVFHSALADLTESPIPIVTAAQGAAAGGGLGLLWAADVVIAAENLKLALGFTRLGLSGDGGSSWHLPRLVGMRRAQELVLGRRVLDAQEAHELGLVSRVVPLDELTTAGEEAAASFASGPTVSLGHMRRLLWRSSTVTAREHLAAEHEAMKACGATEDAAEGVRAFAEKREPRFEGR